METFDRLIADLKQTPGDSLMLGQVPMLLIPRWFFVDIMLRVEELAGAETAARIYYEAGYMGAVKWCALQIEAGLQGRRVLEQYLHSASLRGWGRFEILEFDEEGGRGVFRLHNSAGVQEKGPAPGISCVHFAGSLAGGFQAILDHRDRELRVRGRESFCAAQGHEYCEFVVEPV